MKITLRLFGALKTIIGSRQIQLDLDDPNVTVRDLSTILGAKYGDRVSRLLNSKDDSFNSLRVLINGQDHVVLQGLATKLNDGDLISLLPPLTGGNGMES